MADETSNRNESVGPLAADVFHAREDTLKDAITQLAGAGTDPEGFTGAWAAMSQAASGLDPQQMLNTPHLPENAGEYASALASMLARIPDGWGRWISCGRGWYPLLADLDARLAALLPNYQIEQVKEKYGDLCYYWSPGEEVSDPADPAPVYPGSEISAEQEREWKLAHEAWWGRVCAYRASGSGRERERDLEERISAAEKLVRAAEKAAGRTCELCGAPGEAHCTRAASPWYQTLCVTCAAEREYMPSREWEGWWEEEQPRFEARMRASFVKEHAGKRVVVATADTTVTLALAPAVYCHTAESACAAGGASEEWGVVFVGDDEVGNAFAAALRRRYADQPLPERKRSYRLRGYYLHRKVSDGARDDLAAAGAWCWSAAPEHRAGPVRDD